jgi:hypothetical protein
VNSVNQYTSRTVPGKVDVIGTASASGTVTANNYSSQRKGEYFRVELPIDNSVNAMWQDITVIGVLGNAPNEDIVTTNKGNVFLPKTPEIFSYDADGNLTNSGRWMLSWDAENRMTKIESQTTAPAGSKRKVEFLYDSQSRRIQKIVSTNNGSGYVGQYTNRFVYDGWNLVAVLNQSGTLLKSFVWGTDLSGTMQGAGGVGGLLSMTLHTGGSAGT